eukprot:790539-Rhodomonas_salina.1
MKVESRTGNELTVTRGVGGTTARGHADGVTATLVPMTSVAVSGGISSTTLLVTVDSALAIGAQAGGIGFVLVDREVMRVVDVSGDVLNVSRGEAGTAAVSHLNGAKVTAARQSTLDGALTSATTSVVLSSGSDLFGLAAESHVQVSGEIMRVVSVSGASLVVERAQGGTTATSHPDGSAVVLVRNTVVSMEILLELTTTTIEVVSASAAGFGVGSYGMLGQEIVQVTAVSDDTRLSVDRGVGDTYPATHSGEIALSKVLAAGEEYAVSFSLRNPRSSQSAPTVSITASGSWARTDPIDDVSGAFQFSRICQSGADLCSTSLSADTIDTLLSTTTKRTSLLFALNDSVASTRVV